MHDNAFSIFRDKDINDGFILTKETLDKKSLDFYTYYAKLKYDTIMRDIKDDPETSFMWLSFLDINCNPFSEEGNGEQNFKSISYIKSLNRLFLLNNEDEVKGFYTLFPISDNRRKILGPIFKQYIKKVYDVNDFIFTCMNKYIAEYYLAPILKSFSYTIKDIQVCNLLTIDDVNNINSDYQLINPLLVNECDIYSKSRLDEILQKNDKDVFEIDIILKAYGRLFNIFNNSHKIYNETLTFHKFYGFSNSTLTNMSKFICCIDYIARYIIARLNNKNVLFIPDTYDNNTYLKIIDDNHPFQIVDVIKYNNNETIKSVVKDMNLQSIIGDIPYVDVRFSMGSDNYMQNMYRIIRIFIKDMLMNYLLSTTEISEQYDYEKFSIIIQNIMLFSTNYDDFDNVFRVKDKDTCIIIDKNENINIYYYVDVEYLIYDHNSKLVINHVYHYLCKFSTDGNIDIDDSIYLIVYAGYDQNKYIRSKFDFADEIEIEFKKIMVNIVKHLNVVLSMNKDRIITMCDQLDGAVKTFNDNNMKIYYKGDFDNFITEINYFYGNLHNTNYIHKFKSIGVKLN